MRAPWIISMLLAGCTAAACTAAVGPEKAGAAVGPEKAGYEAKMTVSYQMSPNCRPREAMLNWLSRKFSERPIGRGVGRKGNLVEITVNDETSTWSEIVTSPLGVSCLIRAGQGWKDLTVERWRGGN